MIFTISAAKLAKACSRIKPLINDGRVAAILGCVVLTCEDGFASIRGGNGDSYLTVPLGAAGENLEMLIPFTPLHIFTQGCPEGAEVEISSKPEEPNHVTLKSARRKARLGVPGALADYPLATEREYPMMAQLPARDLATLLGRCLPYVYVGAGREMLAGVCLKRTDETLRGEASDSIGIARVDALAQFVGADVGPVIMPPDTAATVKDLCREFDGDVTLGMGESGFIIKLEGEDGETVMRAPAIGATFPDISPILFDAAPDAPTLPRNATLQAVSRISGMIARDTTKTLWLTSGDGALRIVGKAEGALSEEEIETAGTLEYTQTAPMIARALSTFDGDTVTLTSGNNGAAWRFADPVDQSIVVMVSGLRSGAAPK